MLTVRRGPAVAVAALLLPAGLLVGAPPAAAAVESEPATDTDAATTRYAGADRYGTAALLADAYEDPQAVVVATGEGFADALAGAYLSARVDGPVLLTRRGSLPPVTGQAVDDLDVGTVYVLGGTAAVSDDVVSQLEAVDGVEAVVRIAGADRYATAAAVATTALDGADPADDVGEGASGRRTAVLASGRGFPDALAAAPVARAGSFPLLLVDPAIDLEDVGLVDQLPGPTRQALSDLDVEHVVVAGGPTAVPTPLVAELVDPDGLDLTARRSAGADRYGTAAALAEVGRTLGFDSRVVGLASGLAPADALALGPLAGQAGYPVLLSRPDALPDETAGQLHLAPTLSGQTEVVLAGGRAALSADVRAAASGAAGSGRLLTLGPAPDGSAASLRRAVQEANARLGKTTLLLQPGTYTLSVPGRDEDVAATGDLDVTGDLTIRGPAPGAGAAVLDAGGLDRAFEVLDGATLVLDGRLEVVGGALTDAAGAAGHGGALRVGPGSTALLHEVDVRDSSAPRGGGVANDGGTLRLLGGRVAGSTATGGTLAGQGDGGGLLSTGTTSTVRTDVDGNTAAASGGGTWSGGFLSSEDTVLLNHAEGAGASAGGGGLYVAGSTALVGGTYGPAASAGNRASGQGASGGAVLVDAGRVELLGAGVSYGRADQGGGLAVRGDARVDLVDARLGPSSADEGGGVHVAAGAGLRWTDGVVVGAAADRGGGLFTAGDVVVHGLVLDGGEANSGGGAFVADGGTLSMDRSLVTRSSADGVVGSGGGVFAAGSATLTGSRVVDNEAAFSGGGVEVTGALTLLRSEVADNSARTGSQVDSTGQVLVINSTVSNEGDGGLLTVAAGRLEAWSSSFVVRDGRRALTVGDEDAEGAEVELRNTLVLGDCSGPVVSGGFVATSDPACVTAPEGTDLPGVVDGRVLDLVLRENGARTRTHALLDVPENQLVDGGASSVGTDQRGVRRPQQAADDVGAFELE